MALKSASRLSTHQTRLWGPIGTLSGTSGAGFSPAHTTSPIPSAASRSCSTERPGRPSAPRARPATSIGVRTRPRTPSAARARSDGSGAGTHLSSGSTSGGTGERSKSTVAMSTPATPSTSAWCVFEISAKRFCSRPWMIHTSQSGFERSSRWEKMRPASSRSCSSLPGRGSAVWRTW